MERPIYITPLRWKQWNKPRQKKDFKTKKCVICLEEIGVHFKIYKKKYKKVAQNEIIDRLHKGQTAYPPLKEIVTLRCFHKFHKICIKKWFNRSPTCPLCRR